MITILIHNASNTAFNSLSNENTNKVHQHLGRIHITLAYGNEIEGDMGEWGKKEKWERRQKREKMRRNDIKQGAGLSHYLLTLFSSSNIANAIQPRGQVCSILTDVLCIPAISIITKRDGFQSKSI